MFEWKYTWPKKGLVALWHPKRPFSKGISSKKRLKTLLIKRCFIHLILQLDQKQLTISIIPLKPKLQIIFGLWEGYRNMMSGFGRSLHKWFVTGVPPFACHSEMIFSQGFPRSLFLSLCSTLQSSANTNRLKTMQSIIWISVFQHFFVSWWRNRQLLYDNKRHPGRDPLMWIFRVYVRIQIC